MFNLESSIPNVMTRQEQISRVIVTAQQMRDIEGRIFAQGMPVAALMEKVAGLIVRRLIEFYPRSHFSRCGILVGPGHNGGDALVVARELHFQGYEVVLCIPFSKLKELTSQHAQYIKNLNIPVHETLEPLATCDVFVDGLFGFGLERSLSSPVDRIVDRLNQWSQPVVSIDLPSGLHTDTGEVLGTAVKATQTFCLGLWKLGLLQDQALDYVGKAELIDFDIPITDIQAVLETPKIQRITRQSAIATLPLQRSPVTHKYKQGHLLLICGSRRYTGGAILTALGARASGVGMLSIAVPESLKLLLSAQLPEALIVGCPETESGAIAQLQLPEKTDLSSFDAIACGPGLTVDAQPILQEVIDSDRPLVLDADGLNILAQMGTIPTLQRRQAPTVLTPHAGEFKRLFPNTVAPTKDRIAAVRTAAEQSGAVVLLKGARTAIADPDCVWINPESTPALARGGSGDVLTGLLGGLIAQATTKQIPLLEIVASAAWWHSQAGILAARNRTEMGVDAFTLTQYLLSVLRNTEH
ncbi:NAD(P)H-hydrate dehydratase [Chroococcidiopsis sp. TS-821]|uniref:NAD(P)H-hydrate dehydratase n=1 Tax=Chroococcidiopsis sp. TS-821 TaxID=1378066 RepID=UPI001FEF3CFF|nr:NAD(P)H-hydrate dehydratase [Chroococcidiopsis sp. TS-821]